MAKIMQNLVVMNNQSGYAYKDSLKTGNMILNRFCIDEDAAFELSPTFELSPKYFYDKEYRKGQEYSGN